ncbi:MAG: LysR family transcriptional regulator [Hyphomicrobiales bacterium]
MNLAELQTFLAVVDQRSLVRASEQLNVTQSTVTARIDSLEARLGQKLLERNKSGTELTSAGFKFIRYAEVMTQLWRQAQYEVGLPSGFTSICNVGCYVDLWEGLCDGFLDRVRSLEPAVAAAIWPGDQHNIDRWLETGLVDIAFCYSPQSRGVFAAREIGVDTFVQVAFDPPPGSERSGGYVYVDYGIQFRREHAVAFAGAAPPAVTVASAGWAVDHLLRWGGTGYLPRRRLGDLPKDRTRIVEAAPVLRQAVFLVENTATTAHWPWFAPLADTLSV